MSLTPIHIRGKKRKRSAPKPVPYNKSAPPPSISTSSSASKPTSKAKPKRQKKAVPAMPTLQGLPQELLELVFLYSMNPSLPRSCHSLGRKLSSSTVIMEFVMRSFFCTINHTPKFNSSSWVPTSSRFLQSDLLTCRFFDYSFFLKYVNKAHDALIKLRGKPWESVKVEDARAFEGLWPFKFTKVEHLGFAEGFYIPDKLLHGPWTTEKASLLYVLVSFSGEIDWEGGMAGETAKEGLREAIREGNEHAVAALAVLLGTAKAITTEMILEAAQHSQTNDNNLRHLLFNAQIFYADTPRGALDFYNSSLWAWADTHIDDRGELFKDMLRDAEKFSLNFYRDGETDWTTIVPFPYSGAKFDTRTRFGQLNRELLERLYKNHGRRIATGGRRARSVPRGMLRHDNPSEY